MIDGRAPIRRRLCHLTLARQEWEEVATSLDALEATRESCGPALAALRAQLRSARCEPDELLTIAQPPLSWSPLITGLAYHVLSADSLLPIAERLRDQMMAGARKIESVVRCEGPAEIQSWPSSPAGGIEGRIGSN